MTKWYRKNFLTHTHTHIHTNTKQNVSRYDKLNFIKIKTLHSKKDTMIKVKRQVTHRKNLFTTNGTEKGLVL